MSRTKGNFSVDPSYPAIDAVGHSDKQAYFNVKGGGSTNTTMLDSLPFGSHLLYGWFARAAISPWLNVSGTTKFPPALDPSLNVGGLGSPGCLNGILPGDRFHDRCGDQVLLKRVTVNGTVSRAGGVFYGSDDVPGVAPSLGTYIDPKCFVCLVADLAPDGAAFDSDLVFDPAQNFSVTAGGGSVPWLDHHWSERFRVLAHEIMDFADCPPLAVNIVDQFLFDGVTWQRTISNTSYVYRPCTKGFRFDVDLNNVLVRYSGNTGTFADCTNFALHVCAVWFDGYTNANTGVPLAIQNLGLEYMYRLWFDDFLSPSSFAPAGADGPVVNDETPDLDVLADQSAAMAGDVAVVDAAEPRRKKTKSSEGYYDFRPRFDPSLESFPDDFEFARLKSGKRSKSRFSRGRKNRRVDEPGEFFEDETEPPFRRGKY